MAEIAIFGAAGAIGRAVGAELIRRGINFRAVGRTREKLEDAFGGNAEVVTPDLAQAEEALAAASGVRTIIYAVGVPYTDFRLHPALMRGTIAAAVSAGVERLVVISSVYSYGAPKTARVAETHPRNPESFKGKMRKQQEDAAMQAHRLGQLKAMVVRLPDFYGPFADLSLANPIFRAALAGKAPTWIGPLDVPHEFLFVPDAGPVIVDLALREDCYGESWNLAGAGTITGREFISAVYAAAGAAPKWRVVNKKMLWLAGLFKPMIRELREMYYLQETPVILDDWKLRARLGEVEKTPYETGIRRTLEWMR